MAGVDVAHTNGSTIPVRLIADPQFQSAQRNRKTRVLSSDVLQGLSSVAAENLTNGKNI
jgi:hypothetical protein